jgi:hypothetical protein
VRVSQRFYHLEHLLQLYQVFVAHVADLHREDLLGCALLAFLDDCVATLA